MMLWRLLTDREIDLQINQFCFIIRESILRQSIIHFSAFIRSFELKQLVSNKIFLTKPLISKVSYFRAYCGMVIKLSKR